MPERNPKIIEYNDGKHALMLGHGKPVEAGQQVKTRLQFYSVDEVQVHTKEGSIWTASLTASPARGR